MTTTSDPTEARARPGPELGGLEAPAMVPEGGAGLGAHATPGEPVRAVLGEMLRIAAPTVVTMTSYTVMQFVDAMMVARIGPEEVYVSAQGNGGMLAWLSMAGVLGLVSIVNTFVSQNLGAGRPERGAAYVWNGLWVVAAAAVALSPMILLAPHIFGHMHEQPDLVRMETSYAQILLGGALLQLGARTIAQYFYGMHRPGVVMFSVIAANVINVLANAVLIFGTLGPPEGTPMAGVFRGLAEALGIAPMGVAGAALGTLAGTLLEFALPMIVFLSPREHARFGTRRRWKPCAAHLKDLLRVGWPGGAMFLNEMLCWGYLMAVLLGEAGEAAGEDPTIHNTAGWIALRYMHVSFMPAVGLSIAVTALVGKCMGMGRPDLAARRAHLGLAITVGYMALCALVFVIFRRSLIGVFIDAGMPADKTEHLLAVGSTVMIAAAVFQVFDAVAITISAALRGAGDTVWPGVMTMILSWSCIVGVGHLLIARAPQLGSIGPWIGASAYIMLLGLVLLARFLRGSWKNIRLVENNGPVSDAAV